MSIANQKKMLIDFVIEKGWDTPIELYIDDGYSGTNFERPEFIRMLGDVEDGRINCVVTKDLSRLGRNYSKVGYYSEEYFVEHGVRFIAVNDSFDTMQDEENEVAPFKNILNEWYPRDISKKVRQVKRTAAREGKFMGSQAPYGYKKSPEDKHVLIVDEYPATIMRRIFNDFACGDSARMIAERLNYENVECPRIYHAKHSDGQKLRPNAQYCWGSASIMQMLKNQVYIGNMVQGKRQVTSFKTKKRRSIDPDNWIVVENTHEPIISRDIWDRVQGRINGKVYFSKRRKDKQLSLYSGVLRCAECGSLMASTTRKLKKGNVIAYRCARYVNNGRTSCTVHYILEDVLSAIVMNDIRLYSRMASTDRESIANRLVERMGQLQEQKASFLKHDITEAAERIATIDTSLRSLYEDKCLGKLPENLFLRFMDDFLAEQTALETKLVGLKKQLSGRECVDKNVEKWLSSISRYNEIAELNRHVVMELIESIMISEPSEAESQRKQEIKIKYRFVGNISGV